MEHRKVNEGYDGLLIVPGVAGSLRFYIDDDNSLSSRGLYVHNTNYDHVRVNGHMSGSRNRLKYQFKIIIIFSVYRRNACFEMEK